MFEHKEVKNMTSIIDLDNTDINIPAQVKEKHTPSQNKKH